MEEKCHYYATKGISVVLLLASLCQILLWIGLAVINLSNPKGDIDTEIVFFLLIPMLIYLVIFLFTGALGFFGSIGLFFFKKFGFYLTLVSIAIFVFSGIDIASFSANEHFVFSWWYMIYIVPIIIAIYLLTQRKKIEVFQNSYSVQSKKIILISSLSLCLVLVLYIPAVSFYKDAINQYIVSHYSQNYSNGHNETSYAEQIQNAEQGELLPGSEAIPGGYFVPSTKTFPAGFDGYITFSGNSYGSKFDNYSDMNGNGNPSSIFISESMESATNNYDSRLAYYKNLSSEENREIKEFDFEGIHGIVMDSTIYLGNNDHDLLAKDGQRVLHILAHDGTKTKFSSDDLISMLKTFIRILSQPTQNDPGTSPSAAPTAPSSEDFNNYSDDSFQALSLDSHEVVTGYLWHSYKGSPNFKSVMLPVWRDSTEKDTSKNEYNIDIWNGEHFVFLPVLPRLPRR